MGQPRRSPIFIVHVGLGLGFTMGILSEVGVHDGSSSRGSSIVLSAHPHVVKHGSRIGL